MKAVISTTYDDQYLFFLPITTWLWNRLGVDVICFAPYSNYMWDEAINQIPAQIMRDSLVKYNLKCDIHYFNAPKRKQATYAQCARLYGACLDLPEDEILITSDIDMGLFNLPEELRNPSLLTIFGSDLVPVGQYPMCYASGTVKQWREAMNITDNSYQDCLDKLVGVIECDHFRGNQWSLDQGTLYNSLQGHNHIKLSRARPQTQFASKRYDRDDSFILDRLSLDTIDYHFNRPGFEDGNFQIILKIIQWHFPYEDLTWMRNYCEEYKKLI